MNRRRPAQRLRSRPESYPVLAPRRLSALARRLARFSRQPTPRLSAALSPVDRFADRRRAGCRRAPLLWPRPPQIRQARRTARVSRDEWPTGFRVRATSAFSYKTEMGLKRLQFLPITIAARPIRGR